MRLIIAGLLLGCVGCSTKPIADFLDFTFPARTSQPGAQFYGGVGPPQPTARPLPPIPANPQPTGEPFLDERPPAVPGPPPPPPGL